jgi:hypothetical protein
MINGEGEIGGECGNAFTKGHLRRLPQYERVKPNRGRRRGDESLGYNNPNRLWNEMKDSEKGILETTEEDTSNPFEWWQRIWARNASGNNNNGTEKEGDDY